MIDEILAIAKKEVGVKEVPLGSNRGPRVNEYQECTGLGSKGGFFWCASFVSWCLLQYFKNKKDCPLPITADCDVLLRAARNLGILYSKPQKGDIFIVMKSEYDAIHTGFVTGFDDDEFFTIEGNASGTTGSRNGDGVYAKSRPRQKKYKFIRWAETTKDIVMWNIIFPNGKKMPCHTNDNTNLIKTRDFMNVLFGETETNKHLKYADSKLYWDDKILDDDPFLIDRESYSTVRELVEFTGLKIGTIDNENKLVHIERK